MMEPTEVSRLTSMRAISLECSGAEVLLIIVLEEDGPYAREAVDDLGFEFEAMQLPGTQPRLKVDAYPGPLKEAALEGRRVDLGMEPSTLDAEVSGR
ncbi:hypothetical protein OV208_28705 [Corallococcus sp. bb12-1]|uniref:hypothetical protein n=1 Tax=Corallococcus sp. bb12-1 TaxID=2996784 RepID=UPI0022716E09|nr:hypothetical protein [Corallococcus sp. bb12-1]MCY1045331.1 hypothetical protein [Corallococcus sp. bb12-1]